MSNEWSCVTPNGTLSFQKYVVGAVYLMCLFEPRKGTSLTLIQDLTSVGAPSTLLMLCNETFPVAGAPSNYTLNN